MTAKVRNCVRFRQLDEDGDPTGGQGVFRSLVGLKVSQAITVLEKQLGYPPFHQPMNVNGVPTHRSAARVLRENDVFAAFSSY